jgi:hypothetical protein
MKDTRIIQEYLNNFRRHLAPHLKPGIGLSCRAFPVEAEGGVLEFMIGANRSNEDTFGEPNKTVNAVLEKVPQRMIPGDLGGIRFGGTNISMEPNRIVLIKGEDDPSLWSDQGAKSDVEKIVSSQTRARK